MGRKLSALVTVGALVLASAAIAKSYELEGDLGEAHPSSEVTSQVQVRDGASTLVKTFKFSGLLAKCEDGSIVSVSGESGRPAEIVERNGRRRFETELTRRRSEADVHGHVSRSGKRLKGEIEFVSEGNGCEADARFELTR